MAEYRDKFIELSRYAPKDVAEDGKKHELFLDGLAGPLQYQLMSHTFSSFQRLVDNAISLEYKRRELGDLKRKATRSGQSRSITHPCFTPQQGTPFRFGGPSGNFGQQQYQCSAQQFQHPVQQFQHPGQQTPRPAY